MNFKMFTISKEYTNTYPRLRPLNDPLFVQNLFSYFRESFAIKTRIIDSREIKGIKHAF